MIGDKDIIKFPFYYLKTLFFFVNNYALTITGQVKETSNEKNNALVTD